MQAERENNFFEVTIFESKRSPVNKTKIVLSVHAIAAIRQVQVFFEENPITEIRLLGTNVRYYSPEKYEEIILKLGEAKHGINYLPWERDHWKKWKK